MKRYEYIRLLFDAGDLSGLNRFAGDGWRVVAVFPSEYQHQHYALLERELT